MKKNNYHNMDTISSNPIISNQKIKIKKNQSHLYVTQYQKSTCF